MDGALAVAERGRPQMTAMEIGVATGSFLLIAALAFYFFGPKKATTTRLPLPHTSHTRIRRRHTYPRHNLTRHLCHSARSPLSFRARPPKAGDEESKTPHRLRPSDALNAQPRESREAEPSCRGSGGTPRKQYEGGWEGRPPSMT